MKRILLIIIVITLVANTISVLAASTIPADVIVHFRNDDGWDVIAQNGGQIAPHFFIRVYTQSRAEVRITVEVNGKTVWHKTQIVDFMKEYDLRVEEKGALRITVDFEVKNSDGTIKYNIIREYTIAQSPVAVTPKNIVFTPKQFEQLIENIKMESIAKAAVMAVAGVLIAVLVRSVFLLLEWTNAVNLVLLGAGLLAAYIIDEKLGALYWAAMLLANIVTYKYVRTANLTRFLRFEWDNQNIVETEVPLYEHEGRLAVAFQDSWAAINRVFRNRHVYLEFDSDNEEMTLWMINGEEPCYLIASAKREGDKYVVKPLDTHTQEFMRNRRYFEEIKKQYREVIEDYMRLKATMPIALREVLNSITPDLRLVKELVKPGGGESK